MFGVVCTNPVTGCVEPWTIAGPTDGSTNIVHHDENRDYQLATANDCQYGASYLGITECCKPLYNPSTGNLTVDCATTTATGVDVNVDDTVDVAHPIIAQNYDCDDAEFKNKLIKTSCFSYNPQCYVCNDPVTGNPVRKPVVHIGTLCADEYLGFNEGLPRRTDVCEDCWRQIPFIGEDNGGETLDTSSDCDTFSHNSCTCTTRMEHLELADICKPGDIYQGNIVFNPNMFEYSVKDSTNTFNTRYIGFGVMAGGFNLYDCDTTNSRCRYRLSLNESNSAIETNSLTISPTGNASLCLSLNYIPLTADTESSNYELVGLNVSNNQLKKLDGFSYDPTTCYLCGNFCGNVNIWPYVARWSGSGGRDGCACVDVDAYGFYVSNYCCASGTLTLKSCFRAGCSDILACTPTNCISLDTVGYTGIMDLCSCCLIRMKSCSEITLSADCNIIANANYVGLNACCSIYINSDCDVVIEAEQNTNTFGAHTFETLRWEDNNKQCTSIFNDYNELRFVACQNGTVLACHDIYTGNSYSCPNRLAVCCDANVGWQAYALMCDLSAAGDTAYITDSHNYTSFADLLTCIASCRTVVPGVFNFSSAITFSDSRGQTYQTNEFVGTFFKQNANTGHFNGMFYWPSKGLYSINFWYSAGSMSSTWTIVTPIPGTMYGTASVNGINIEGTI